MRGAPAGASAQRQPQNFPPRNAIVSAPEKFFSAAERDHFRGAKKTFRPGACHAHRAGDVQGGDTALCAVPIRPYLPRSFASFPLCRDTL